MDVDDFVRNLRYSHRVLEGFVVRFSSVQLLVVRHEDHRYRIVACDRVDVLHRVLDHQVVPLRVSGYLEVVQVVDDDELASFSNEVLYQRSYVVDLHALLRVRLDVENVPEPV